MYCKLLPFLNSDMVTLTANQRLSQRILEEYEQYQHSQQQIVWETPSVLPLSTFFSGLWSNHASASQRLLNDFQEHLIWQKIIHETNTVPTHLPIHSLASLAQRTWQMMTLWNIPLSELENEVSEEVSTFALWAKKAQKQLEANQWVTTAQLPSALTTLAKQSALALPKAIYLIGFDELPPATQGFFDQISTNTPVTLMEPTGEIAKPQRLTLTDQEDELQEMASWAKAQWESLSKTKTNPRITCIVPNLTQIRSQVLRVFTDIFSPQEQLPASSPSTLPFNLSAGQALNTFPIIKTALAILRYNKTCSPLEDLSALLSSPYVNSKATEACLAAHLDVCLREQGEKRVSHQSVSLHLKKLNQQYPGTSLLCRWEAFLNCQITHQRNTHAEWADYFAKQLKALGWPGERSLNSLEYQLQKRWEKLLTEFATLDAVSTPQTHNAALKNLLYLTQQTLFQAESKALPIQILGVLEASGLSFDAVWVMGLDDESWPSRPQPSPFLPVSLQKKYQLPHASSARELSYALQLQKRLFTASKNVIVSSSKQEGDKLLRPSRLIQGLPEINIEDLSKTTTSHLAETLYKTQQLEYITDQQAPPLLAEERIYGGSWILKQQAACPFRAFASIRLQAKSLNEPEIGLDAAERGTLVHRVLEKAWEVLKTQATLKTYTEEKLRALLKDIVTTVTLAETKHVTKIEAKNSNKNAFLRIEKRRITKLAFDWLTFEKTRSPFQVIEREMRQGIQIKNLDLTIQIDRLDKLEDGSTLLIDYKTGGHHRIDHWFGSRPEDPQLPLYCTYAAPYAQGMLVAQVKNGDFSFKGLLDQTLAKTEAFSQTEHIEWSSVLNDWQQSLEQLSHDFCTGHAAVDPLEPLSTCQFCDLHPLCRIGDSA